MQYKNTNKFKRQDGRSCNGKFEMKNGVLATTHGIMVNLECNTEEATVKYTMLISIIKAKKIKNCKPQVHSNRVFHFLGRIKKSFSLTMAGFTSEKSETG